MVATEASDLGHIDEQRYKGSKIGTRVLGVGTWLWEQDLILNPTG